MCKASLLFVYEYLCVNTPNSKYKPPNLWYWYYVTPKFINPTIHFFFYERRGFKSKRPWWVGSLFFFATHAELFHVQKAPQLNARTPSTNLSPSKEAALHKRGEKYGASSTLKVVSGPYTFITRHCTFYPWIHNLNVGPFSSLWVGPQKIQHTFFSIDILNFLIFLKRRAIEP